MATKFEYRVSNNGNSPDGILVIDTNGNVRPNGVFGIVRFVDATNGSDNNDGASASSAFKTLTTALAAMTTGDILYAAPGDYSGNYQTPLNSVAPFCTIIGAGNTNMGFASWGAGTAGSAFLEVRARGWRITGFEFDGVSDEASVKLTTSGTSNATNTQIDNCLFTGGKYGIDWVGAPTYTTVRDNKFEDILTSAFTCTDSSGDTPQRCTIEGNRFVENAAHIDMGSGGAARGFKASTIKGNFFGQDGIARDATVLIDNRGGASTQIIDNYLDVTKTQYGDDASTAFIRTAAGDFGAGNLCNDGIPAADISL